MPIAILEKLKGHTGSVSYVTASGKEGLGLVATVSDDDGTIRFWDMRTAGSPRHAVRSILLGKGCGITCCSFAVPRDASGDAAAGAAPLFYVGVGERVLEYDLRASTDILLRAPTRPASAEGTLLGEGARPAEGDDLNELSYAWLKTSAKRPAVPAIAAPCDDGTVRVFRADDGCELRRLSGGHDNICSCARWAPGCPGILVSGGMDCTAALWDVRKGELLAKTSFKEEKPGMTVNPPFANALDFAPDGQHFAVALGDGKVAVLAWERQYQQGQFCKVATVEAHMAPAAGVCFLPWTRTKKRRLPLILSGGTDAAVTVVDANVPKGGKALVSQEIGAKVNWLASSPTEPYAFVATESNEVSVVTFN